LKEESAVKRRRATLRGRTSAKAKCTVNLNVRKKCISKTGFDTDIRAYICWFSYVSYGTEERSEDRSSDSDASHHKKASVMNMVKGEMKMLLARRAGTGKGGRGREVKKQGSD